MIDIKLQKFGKLTAIEFSHLGKNRHAVWKCKCDCGNVTSAETRQLRNGTRISCGCLHKRIGKDNPTWKGCGDFSLTKFNKIKQEAKLRNLEFNVTIEFLWDLFRKQDGKCKLSGEPLLFQSKVKYFDGNASLDRIDSSKGYIVGNVQWVHKDVNVMKWDLSLERFFDLIKKINSNMDVNEKGSSLTLSR